jgi:hypothetical protein
MSRLRFATARALFETFPSSVTRITAAPTDESPLIFLKKLSADEQFNDAVTFCAYLLPRRATVWWACGSVRAFFGDIGLDRAAGLGAAETWVHEPSEQHRMIALDVGNKGDSNNAMTWLALAAGWAGGVLGPQPKASVPVPQYLTPCAARIAVLLSANGLEPAQRTSRMRTRIAEGIKLAEDDR